MGNQNCSAVGDLKFDQSLKEEHAKYLCKFSNIIHYKRNLELVDKFPDPIRSDPLRSD